MFASNEVAAVLGLATGSLGTLSPIKPIGRIEHGLPIRSVDKIARLLAPGDTQFNYRRSRRRRLNAERRQTSCRRRRARDWLVWQTSGTSRATFGAATTKRAISCFARIQWRRTGFHRSCDFRASSVRRIHRRHPRRSQVRLGGVSAQVLDRGLTAYRMGDPFGAHPIFDATGSVLAPGRWNTPGSPMIYARERFSTAMLEKLARGSGRLPPNQHYIQIAIPRGLTYEVFSPPSLPGWDSMPATVSRAFGEGWCVERREPSSSSFPA